MCFGAGVSSYTAAHLPEQYPELLQSASCFVAAAAAVLSYSVHDAVADAAPAVLSLQVAVAVTCLQQQLAVIIITTIMLVGCQARMVVDGMLAKHQAVA